MKKALRFCSIMLATLSLFTACGGNTGTPSAAENVEKSPSAAPLTSAPQASEVSSELQGVLTLLSFTEYHDAVQAAIDAFQTSNPGITVNMEEYPYAQYSDAVEIKLGSSSKDFDVIMTDATMVSAYAYRGWIAPLESYFSTEEKARYASALVDSSTYEGSFYSPPLCNSCQVLWYNKDLFDLAGLDYPSEDPSERLTWNKVVELSQQVMQAANDNSIYGLTFEQVDRPYQVLPIPNSYGGNAFAADGMTVDGYLNSEAFVKGMQFYADIHNTYNIAPKGTSPSDSLGLFTAGKLLFVAGNIFDFSTFEAIENLNYGFTAFPYFSDGIKVSPTDSWHVSLSSFSQNQDLAIEFIKYFTLGEGNDIFLDTRGAFAAKVETLEAYSSEPKYNEFPYTVFKLASYEAQNTAYPRPSTLAYGEFESIITSTFSDIRNGIDVQESLDAAVEQINSQMAVYR